MTTLDAGLLAILMVGAFLGAAVFMLADRSLARWLERERLRDLAASQRAEERDRLQEALRGCPGSVVEAVIDSLALHPTAPVVLVTDDGSVPAVRAFVPRLIVVRPGVRLRALLRRSVRPVRAVVWLTREPEDVGSLLRLQGWIEYQLTPAITDGRVLLVGPIAVGVGIGAEPQARDRSAIQG